MHKRGTRERRRRSRRSHSVLHEQNVVTAKELREHTRKELFDNIEDIEAERDGKTWRQVGRLAPELRLEGLGVLADRLAERPLLERTHHLAANLPAQAASLSRLVLTVRGSYLIKGLACLQVLQSFHDLRVLLAQNVAHLPRDQYAKSGQMSSYGMRIPSNEAHTWVHARVYLHFGTTTLLAATATAFFLLCLASLLLRWHVYAQEKCEYWQCPFGARNSRKCVRK